MTSEFLSWEKIKNLYPNQWVILSEYQYKPNSVFLVGGKVVFFGENSAQAWEQTKQLPQNIRPINVIYTGDFDDEEELFFHKPII